MLSFKPHTPPGFGKLTVRTETWSTVSMLARRIVRSAPYKPA